MALDLVYALNEIAIELQISIQSEEHIYELFDKMVVSLGLRGGIAILEEQGDILVFKTIGLSTPLQKVMSSLEDRINTRAKGYSISVENVDTYKKVISEGEAIFVEDTSKIAIQVIPRGLRSVVSPLMSLLGNTPGVYVPLIFAGEVRGMLNIAGSELKEDDIPAIRAFANQIAVALENADLVQQLKYANENLEQRVEERTHRLNIMVNAMAGREVRMAELKRVIKKLRKQLIENGIEPIADDPLNDPLADEFFDEGNKAQG